MSARGALTVVGYAVGSYFGYPTAGALIGSEIGGAIDGPIETVGPRQDVRAPKITYGGALPRVYGCHPVAGFLAWCSEKIEVAHEDDQGGKGAPTAVSTTFTYKVNCIFVLSERTDSEVGQPKAIVRVWRDKQLIWTALADSDAESLQASLETEAWEHITFLDGNPEQLPWPIYETAVGTENAIAYRGRASVAIQGLDCGPSGQMPLLEFELATAVSSIDGSLLFDAPYEDDESDATDAPTASFTLTNASKVAVVGGSLELTQTASDGSGVVSYSGGKLGTVDDEPVTVQIDDFRLEAIGGSGTGDNWRFLIVHSAAYQFSFGIKVAGVVAQLTTMVISNVAEMGAITNVHGIALNGQYRLVIDPVDNNAKFFYEDTLVWTFDPTAYEVGAVGPMGTSLSLGIANSVPTPGPRLFSYGRVRVYAGQLRGDTVDPAPVDLAEVVKSEWMRCRLLSEDVIDVTDLVGVPVRGVVASGSPAEITARLAAAYYFDVLCNDKLRTKRRGSASVATIPFLDTGVAEGEPGEPFTGLTRENEIEQPARVAVTYLNLDANYEPGTESSDRLVTPSSEIRQINLGMVLTPPEAKGRASTMALDARVASNTGQFTVSDEYVEIDCGDVVTVLDHEDTSWRVRVLRTSDSGGVRSIDVCLDDPDVLADEAVTSDAYSPSITVRPKGETTLVLLDLPLLRDVDDTTGEYVATKIEGGTGSASGVFKSTDGINFGSVTTITDEAVIGTTESALGAWTEGHKFDEVSSVIVNVGDGTLSSSTRGALLTNPAVNAAAIGADGRWEIVQFRTATLVSTGVYKLRGLLRGRKGTEWAISTHQADDTFVLLSQAGLRRISLNREELGLLRYWKGVTLGRALTTVTPQQHTPMGMSQKPNSPVHLRIATVPSTGDKTLTWTRRTRLTDRFGGTVGDSVRLGERSESYQVRIYSDDTFDTLVSTYNATAQQLPYSADYQTADFGDVQSGLHWGVCMRSEYVGLGYEALSNGTSRAFPTS